MTEQTMVGRVADAICSESVAWLKAPLCRMAYEDMARAAIGRMRAPNNTMEDAGINGLDEVVGDNNVRREHLVVSYRAMIDAALEEPEPKGRKP